MQESITDLERWEQFWKKQRSWKQNFFQMLLYIFRFIVSYVRYRLVSKFFGGGYILEVGCGTARSSILLAENKKNSEVIGVDFSRGSIAIAKEISEKHRVNGSFILASVKWLPFKQGLFDLVWSIGVLEHFREPYPIIKEMVRVTRKRGVVIALIPSHNNILVKIRDFIEKITGYHFDFKKAWGGAKAYRTDLNDAFIKVNLHNVRSRVIPLELLIEKMVIGWKR